VVLDILLKNYYVLVWNFGVVKSVYLVFCMLSSLPAEEGDDGDGGDDGDDDCA
jgi:hypothetical protein